VVWFDGWGWLAGLGHGRVSPMFRPCLAVPTCG
jgi:hypothetical protein